MVGSADVRQRVMAATEEISMVEAVSAMAETMPVVLMAAAAAVAGWRSGQDGLLGRHGVALRRQTLGRDEGERRGPERNVLLRRQTLHSYLLRRQTLSL